MNFVIDSKNPYAESLFGRLGRVRLLPTAQITREAVMDADAVIVRTETKIDEAFLGGTKVRFVGTATIGTDHVDLEYLRKHGIGFASAPGSNANSVAEYIVAALLALAIRRERPLAGQSIGVVGVGNVGSRVVAVARALGMKVLMNDPPLQRQTGDGSFLPIDALMDADVVTIHVPLTRSGQDPTWHLFDEKRLRAVHRGATLINTSRGAVVDNAALTKALTDGHFSSAVLDVWEGEPEIPADLLRRTALGTPHIAGYSFDGKVNAIRMMFEAACAHFGLDADRSIPEMVNERKQSVSLTPAESREAGLLQAVQSAYDIERDDAALRSMLDLPVGQRKAHFRRLRAEYPMRHEFCHTRVTGPDNTGSLRDTLAALGFTVG